ncbi:MAG: phospholipase D family protein [Dokdonella sp.]|nr:phospholipase D family protein [Dokdonella sp.]
MLMTQPDDISSAMRDLILNSSRLSIAVAFWGRGACEFLRIDDAPRGSRILLNADSGACNPAELRKLSKRRNVEVRNEPRLHAKVLISESRLILGSANASANGLGFQAHEIFGWHEACVELRDSKCLSASAAWFDERWRKAERWSESVLRRAESAWKSVRRRAASLALSAGSYELMIDSYEGAPVYVVVTDGGATFDEEEAKSLSSEAGIFTERLDYYEEWPDMPQDALLLAYSAKRNAKLISFDDVWDSSSPVRMIRLKSNIRIYPVYKASSDALEKFGLPLVDRLNWFGAVSRVIELMRRDRSLKANLNSRGASISRPTDWCMSLYDFLQLCSANRISVPLL